MLGICSYSFQNYTFLHSETVAFLAQCQVPSTSHEGPSANPIAIILHTRLVCLATCWILDAVCADRTSMTATDPKNQNNEIKRTQKA